jgi:hypothetical protein
MSLQPGAAVTKSNYYLSITGKKYTKKNLVSPSLLKSTEYKLLREMFGPKKNKKE